MIDPVGPIYSKFNAGDASPASNEKKSPVSYNDFLRLLLAQLKYQDPTNAADPASFINQLAMLTNVEQSTNINKSVMDTNKKLDDLFASNMMNAAASYIGKKVETEDGKVSGIIKSVAIYKDGLIAYLEDGKPVLIGPGVKISDPTKPKEEELA